MSPHRLHRASTRKMSLRKCGRDSETDSPDKTDDLEPEIREKRVLLPPGGTQRGSSGFKIGRRRRNRSRRSVPQKHQESAVCFRSVWRAAFFCRAAAAAAMSALSTLPQTITTQTGARNSKRPNVFEIAKDFNFFLKIKLPTHISLL